MAFTGPTPAGVIEKFSAPMPISDIASNGRPAISPQIRAGTSAFLQASSTRFRKRRIAGLSQS